MAFELFCAVVIALAFAAFVAFAGYRFFLVLLPIWGFVWGFGLGAQSVQLLFQEQTMLASVTSWVVAFFVGVLFAVLSYLFYLAAVALFSASIGYALGVALMGLVFPPGFITWLVAIVLAVVVAFVVLRYNIQKYVIIIGTAVMGAGVSVAVIAAGLGGMQKFQLYFEDPIKAIMSTVGWFGWLVFLAIAIGGAFVQWRASDKYTVQAYENRI